MGSFSMISGRAIIRLALETQRGPLFVSFLFNKERCTAPAWWGNEEAEHSLTCRAQKAAEQRSA